MAQETLAVHLLLNDAGYSAGMAKAATQTKQLGASGATAAGGMTKLSAGFKGVVAPMLGIAAAMGAIGAAKWAVDTVIDFETAFAGVEKTVEGTDAQMAQLEQGIIDMSKELPASTTEIAAVAEAAGQLGIQTESVLDFTRTMIDLGETTNLSADEAATALARFANITGMADSEFGNLGSTIVWLGNNFATTEAEIVAMSTRMAAAGTQVGLTEAEILGFAASLSSVGIEAQAGGTAFTKALVEVEMAVLDAGDELDTFAQVAGMSADEFAKAWTEEPEEAFLAFLEGTQGMVENGENVDAMLASVGLSGIRTSQAIKGLASDIDGTRLAVTGGNDAWADNIALTEEAEKRYATAASKIAVLGNNIEAVVIVAGKKFLPALVDGVESVTDAVQELGKYIQILGEQMAPAFENLARLLGELFTLIAPIAEVMLMAFGGAVYAAVWALSEIIEHTAGFLADHADAVALLAAIYVGTLVPSIYAAISAFITMAGAKLADWAMNAGDAIRHLGSTMSAATGNALAFGGPLAILAVGFIKLQQDAEKNRREMANWASAIEETGDAVAATSGMLDDALPGMDQFRGALVEMGANSDDFAAALHGTDEAWEAFKAQMIATGELTDLEAQALDKFRDNALGAADAAGELGEVEGEAVGPSEELQGAIDEVAGAFTDAEQAIEDYKNELAAMLDPLFGAVEAQRQMEDAQTAVTEASAGVIGAQMAYNDAVAAFGPDSAEAQAAQAELVEAQRAHEDSLTAAAQAAWDMDVAMTTLAADVAAGNMPIEAAKERLQLWVDQSWITQAQADAVAASFEEMGEQAEDLPNDIGILVEVATDEAKAAIDDVLVELGILDGETGEPTIIAKDDPFYETQQAVLFALGMLDAEEVSPEIAADAESYWEDDAEVTAAMDVIAGLVSEPTIDADSEPFDEELRQAALDGREFDSKTYEPGLDADPDPFDKKMSGAEKRGGDFDDDEFEADVAGDKGEFDKTLNKAKALGGLFKRTSFAASVGLIDNATSRMRGIMGTLASMAAQVIRVNILAGVGNADGGYWPQSFADGGIVTYQHGGLANSMDYPHTASIFPSGGTTGRIFAEPETGGEAYIPLSAAKRQQSLAVLQATAAHFGLTVSKPLDSSPVLSSISPSGGGGQMVSISPGAVQVTVSGGNMNEASVAQEVRQQLGPALNTFASKLSSEIRTRR